jgi:hypothetical protein
MPQPQARPLPKPAELWLSRPPFSLIARIVAVDEESTQPMVSYELHDEDGEVLDRVDNVVLDRGW